MQKSMLVAAFLLPLLIIIPVSAHAQSTVTATITSDRPDNRAIEERMGTFTITFSESVTGFTASDISFQHVILGATRLEDFTGSGAVYQISGLLNDGQNEGRITIRLIAAEVLRLDGTATTVDSNARNLLFTILPTVTLTANAGGNLPNGGVTDADTIRFTARFSEHVTNVGSNDFSVRSTAPAGTHTVTGYMSTSSSSTSGTVFRFSVDRNGTDGTIRVSVPENRVIDLSDGFNRASAAFIATFGPADNTAPGVTLSADVGNDERTVDDSVRFTATFSERVPEGFFTQEDITVASTATSGTHVASAPVASGTDGTAFTFDVPRNDAEGTITVSIPAGAVTDFAGNDNTASATHTINFGVRPVVITASVGNNTITTDTVTFTATFSSPIMPDTFTASDITVVSTAPANTHVASEPVANMDNTAFTFNVPRNSMDGTIMVSIPQGAVTHTDDFVNEASDVYHVIISTAMPITTEIADTTPVGANGKATFTVTFGDTATGFELDDITVSSAGTHVPSNLTGSGDTYMFDVLRGAADGTITVSIQAGVVVAGVRTNSASNVVSHDLELVLSIDYAPEGFITRNVGDSLDIDFSLSGGLMYITNGGTEDAIHRYNLGMDFDIMTAPVGHDQRFAITRDSAPRSIEFSANRLKVFVLGGQNDMVDAYNLGSIFSIQPSPTYDGESLSIASATTAPAGLEFSRDGTHMYVLSSSGGEGRIYEFPLDTAFDVSTGQAGRFSTSPVLDDRFPSAIVINNDGTIMYVLGSHNVLNDGFRNIYAYTFGVAYDVTTLNFEAMHPLINSATRGMTISSDFRDLHVVANSEVVSRFSINRVPTLNDATFDFIEGADTSTQDPIQGSDPDGDTLAYRLSNHPSWLSIDVNTGQLSGAVPQDNSPAFGNVGTPARCSVEGSVSFTVTVSDDSFDADTTDDVMRTYTASIQNTQRSPNAVPTVNVDANISIPEGFGMLDLSTYTDDTDTADILTYALMDFAGDAITPNSASINADTGLVTFTPAGAGTGTAQYTVCDGSDSADLEVTFETAAPREDIDDQTIQEGQTLDDLNLYIISHTTSPLFNVTQITGEIGVPIFTINGTQPITPLPELPTNVTDFPMGNPDLNGTAPGGGSENNDNLQTAFRISSTEELGDDDPRLDARFIEEARQIVAGVPIDEVINPRIIMHRIPNDFVDNSLAQSPPIPINYVYMLENGSLFSGTFDIIVNRTDAAPNSTLPTFYVLNPTDDTMVINLADHFTDPEGDEIMYNVTNQNPRIADVTLATDMLSIDPVSSGSTGVRLCAESQATGIENAVYCESFLVTVRSATTRSDIFLESSLVVYHASTSQSVTLDASVFAIDPAIHFESVIITADNAAATGEIQINRTGTFVFREFNATGHLVNSTRILTNSTGEISYNPESTENGQSESVTFTAVLHDLATDSRNAQRGAEILISEAIIPLRHDDLTVNYVLRFSDARPNVLVGINDLPPRHVSDIYSIPIGDLFDDVDNTRPGGPDVTITNIANPGAINAEIIGDILRVTPRSEGRNSASAVTFALDDGTNTPVNANLRFKFRTSMDEAAPVGFPQSPITRYVLPLEFEPFVIDLADVFVNGTQDDTAIRPVIPGTGNTFIDEIDILDVVLPETPTGAADTSKLTITHDGNTFMISPGTDQLASEFITFDVFLTGRTDSDSRLFNNYVLQFNRALASQAPSGGSDDSRWKSKATFGKSYSTGLKSVDCGYSMDGTCRNVTDYHVDYLRKSIETDSYHDFTLKTSAPNGLRSLGIAFGVPNIGSSLNAAEAQVDVTLERDYTLNSTYKITDVTYTNENNVIGEDAGFSIQKSKCQPSDPERECVTLNIDGVQFREQMYHAPFVIHAMDSRGYVTIHYMNDGLLISGDSLNEPPTHDLTAKLAHQRDLAQLSLTRTDKLSDVWTDQFGYTWTKNSYGTWSYVEGPKIVVSPICDDPDKRVCNAFAQKLAAYNIQLENLRDSLYGKAYTMPAFDDLHETLTIYDIDGDSRERFLADNDLLWLLE